MKILVRGVSEQAFSVFVRDRDLYDEGRIVLLRIGLIHEVIMPIWWGHNARTIGSIR